MVAFIDSSAILKLFIVEKGTKEVYEYYEKSDEVIVAPIADLEAHSGVRRLRIENVIHEERYREIREEINRIFSFFETVEFSHALKDEANKIIDKYQLKTLDSIQLAAAKIYDGIDTFICCDKKLLKAAKSEGLKVINPMD